MIDVTFAAHGSPYYSAARLNGLVMANADAFEAALPDVTVLSAPVDLCTEEICYGVPCRTEHMGADQQAGTNTNQTSHAGVNITYMYVNIRYTTSLSLMYVLSRLLCIVSAQC